MTGHVVISRMFAKTEAEFDELLEFVQAQGFALLPWQEALLRRLYVQVGELEPGRWWRVIAADGSLWCETSDEEEARSFVRPGDTLERLFVGSRPSVWRAA